MTIKTIAAFVFLVIVQPGFAQSGWQYSKWSNPLYADVYDQFILEGRYIQLPSSGEVKTPALVLHCSDNKFRTGELQLGAIAQPQPSAHSLKGNPQVHVLMRLDGKPKPREDFWEISNDGQMLFFDRNEFNALLTGKLLGHPGDESTVARKVTIGIVEAFANQVAIEFDIPDDTSTLIKPCGLEWGKGKKKLEAN